MFIFVILVDTKFYGKRIRVRLAIKIERQGKQILDQTVMLLSFTETAAYMCMVLAETRPAQWVTT